MFGRALRAGFRAAMLSGRGPLRASGNAAVYADAFTIALAASSGATNSPVAGTVTPTGGPLSAAATVTLSCGTGTFADATLDFASGATAAQTFSFTPTSDAVHAVAMTNTLGLTNSGSPASYTSSTTGPTSIAISGASTGTTGAAVTLTFTLDAAATAAVTVTPTPVAGVTYSTPAVIAIGQTSTTCTMTRAADGSHSVAATTSPSLTVTGGYTFTSSSLSSSGDLPANTITTGSTASTAVTYGQPFKEGALSPADGLAGRQLNILTLWPDGSVKHALVTRVVSGSTSYSDTLTIGTAASGTALAIADLKAALSQPVAFDGGAFGTASFSGTDWDTPHTVVATGPLMSSWVHRKAFSGDSHLVSWVETRIFSTGAVEVFPWVENGYLTVATPTNKSATYTFTMGGTLRFSEAIDIKHHTRVPLVSTSTSEGSATSFSHWLGSDPVAVPAHDGAYLRASKVIPNSYWAAPSGTALDAAQQTYTPNTLAGDTNATGGTGGAGAIISAQSAMYVNSGDLRSWKAMMAHALSAGSWSWHYRDSTTHQPALYATYATNGIGDATIPAGTGGENHTGGPAMSHMPSYAYLPFLVTGRWWFLEELQFQATWGFLSVSPSYRGNGTPAIDTGSGYTVRGGAWSMNLAAQAASATPSSHALSAQFVATWERTTALLYGKYVAGTIGAGAWVSPLGVMGSYSGDVGQPTPWPPTTPGTAWWDAMYQHNYVAAVLGYSSDIGIAQSSTSFADHVAARNHSYKLVIGRADDGLSGRYNWRRFICFAAPIGTNATGLPLDAYYSTHAQMYAELLAGYSLTSLSANYGLSLKQHSSDSDLTSADSSRAYGSTAVSVLAMAAEHGVEGANAGYYRVTGASNFSSSFSTYVADDSPQWAVRPRLPTWLPATNTVADLTSNTVDDGMGFTSLAWRAWGDAVWMPFVGRYGSFVSGWGGHGDNYHNALTKTDIDTRLNTRIKDDAPALNRNLNNGATLGDVADGAEGAGGADYHGNGTGFMWATTTEGNFTVQTGEQGSTHGHAVTCWLPESAFPGESAPDGWLYRPAHIGFYDSGQSGTWTAHRLKVGENLWEITGPTHATKLLSAFNWWHHGYATAYDPTRGRIWYHFVSGDSGGAPNLYLGYRTLSTGAAGEVAFSAGTNTPTAYQGGYAPLEYSSRHDLLIHLADGEEGDSLYDYTKVVVWDPVTALLHQPTQTGTAPTLNIKSVARCWSDSLNCAIFYPGDGTNTVYFLKPSGDPRTASWAWSSCTLTGTVRSANVSGYNAAYSRLRHLPALGNYLWWGARTDQVSQILCVTPP